MDGLSARCKLQVHYRVVAPAAFTSVVETAVRNTCENNHSAGSFIFLNYSSHYRKALATISKGLLSGIFVLQKKRLRYTAERSWTVPQEKWQLCSSIASQRVIQNLWFIASFIKRKIASVFSEFLYKNITIVQHNYKILNFLFTEEIARYYVCSSKCAGTQQFRIRRDSTLKRTAS